MIDWNEELAEACNYGPDCPAGIADFCPFDDVFEDHPCMAGVVSAEMWDEVKDRNSMLYAEAIAIINGEEL